MDFCVVSGWESGQEVAGSPLMLMNAWILFRTSISFEGNNPPLQIRSFGGNWGKCNQTAMIQIHFSPLSWWDKTYMLQIVLIYHGMKLMITLCLCHLFCFWCLAVKASPMSNTFSLIFSLKDDSARNNRVEFVACCLYTHWSSKFPTQHRLVSSFTPK